MVFQFEHVGVDHGASKWERRPLHLPDLKAIMGRWQAGLADAGWNSLYWCNHDQPRVVSRFGDDGAYRVTSAKALATVLHLHRGTPYVYQGEELGLPNASFGRVDDLRDVESLNHYRAEVAAGRDPDEVLASIRPVSRDNARTPIPWADGPNAGFCPPGVDPWIAVDPGHVALHAAGQRDDPSSVFAHYRRLIDLRHRDPVVALGDFTMLLPEHEYVYAFTRALDGVRLLVLAHLGSGGDAAEVAVQVPDGARWAAAEVLLASGHGGDGTAARIGADGTWHPGPWDALVLRMAP
jgi:oligo-1,6-glucosidase